MRELLIATKNPGKFKEICEALEGAPFSLVSLADLKIDDRDFVEDGETFIDNAVKKARYYYDKTRILSLGEDSGILVDALSGELGVKTRRWGAGENSSDSEWLDFFMKRMEGRENRGAKFVCSACIFGKSENGQEICRNFFGETVGKISEKIETEILPGIPLSSCFIPDGFNRAYASLSVSEKNAISHRGKAMSGAKKFLLNFQA